MWLIPGIQEIKRDPLYHTHLPTVTLLESPLHEVLDPSSPSPTPEGPGAEGSKIGTSKLWPTGKIWPTACVYK